MRDAFATFERWLDWNWPGDAGLNDPITARQTKSLQYAIGRSLPDDYVDFLKIHNGQAFGAGGLIGGFELMSSDNVVAQCLMLNGKFQPSEGNRPGFCTSKMSGEAWRSETWVPFARKGCDHFLCFEPRSIRLEPQARVVMISLESGEKKIVGSSFKSWLMAYLTQVFEGDIVYSSEHGGLVHREEAEC